MQASQYPVVSHAGIVKFLKFQCWKLKRYPSITVAQLKTNVLYTVWGSR